MSLDKSKIEHLPDLTDRLLADRLENNPHHQSELLAVEIAEWRSTVMNQYKVRYVAGRATSHRRECLVVSSNRSEDGSIVGRELPTVDSCTDYKIITKL